VALSAISSFYFNRVVKDKNQAIEFKYIASNIENGNGNSIEKKLRPNPSIFGIIMFVRQKLIMNIRT